MKTLLYLEAGTNIVPILYGEFDRYIYMDKRPLDNLNDTLIDDFIAKIKSYGFRVKLRQISYIHPFYIKCYNEEKYIKYYFNTELPTSSMLMFESLDAIYVNADYDIELVKSRCKPFMKDNCAIMRTSCQQLLQ